MSEYEFPGQSGVRDPLKVAINNGASGTGARHWWLQRLTAVALIPLTLWFLFYVATLTGQDHSVVVASIGDPIHAGLLIVLAICVYWHGMLGLDVIIGDYVHTRWLELTLQIALRFGAFLGAVITVLAVLATWLAPAG